LNTELLRSGKPWRIAGGSEENQQAMVLDDNSTSTQEETSESCGPSKASIAESIECSLQQAGVINERVQIFWNSETPATGRHSNANRPSNRHNTLSDGGWATQEKTLPGTKSKQNKHLLNEV